MFHHLAVPMLPNPHLPRQNLAGSGMTNPTHVPDHHCHSVDHCKDHQKFQSKTTNLPILCNKVEDDDDGGGRSAKSKIATPEYSE